MVGPQRVVDTNLDQLRKGVVGGLIALVLVFAYVGMVLVLRFPFPLGESLLVLLLAGVAGIALLLARSRPELAGHVLVWGLTGWLLVSMWQIEFAWLPFLVLILVLIDVVLVRGSEILSALLVTLVAASLAYSGARDYPMWGLFLATLLSLATAELVAWRLYEALDWSWSYYTRTQVLVAEARDRQGELNQTLKVLADRNLQLTRLNQLAQRLRQAADDARRAKEQFVANVSHELRTPLNMVLGFSEMITRSPEVYEAAIPPTLMADLSVIHRNAGHLSALIDDVLDLSQVEAGRMALSKEPLSMETLIEETAMLVRPLYELKGLDLTLGSSLDLPLVLCDRTRIRQVLLNWLT